MKICYKCKINEAKYSNGKCKPCNTAHMVEYRKTDKYKEYQVKNYENTKEKRLNWKKQYYQEHKAERAEYMKNYTHTPTMSPEEQSKISNAVNNILIAPFNKDKWSFE
jgi:hypothetical protein